jgi:D-glycero-D-manno-heptose 1,7-bisphosphate phosphatase
MREEASRKKRAVFLDRDGVINRALVVEGRPYPPRSVSEVEILPDVPDALRRLSEAGFFLVIATNQPDIARGLLDWETLGRIHGRIRSEVRIDDVFVCGHDDGDACECRKPLPGMLVSASEKWDVDLARSYMVGDRWRDVEAGRRAGCRTVLVDRGYDEILTLPPDCCVGSLAEAAEWILAELRAGR